MTYVAPYSEVVEQLRQFAAQRPDRCRLFTLGKPVQGREILGLRAGTRGKPEVLCIAGQHPHEHAGVWGVVGIADFMSSLLPEAEALRGKLACIPARPCATSSPGATASPTPSMR